MIHDLKFDNIEVEIGGQVIDKHYGHWMEAHAELTEPNYGVTSSNTGDIDIQDTQSVGLSPFQVTSGAGGVKISDVREE